MIRSKKIKNSARDEDCSLQIFPYCNMDPSTTILAHLNSEWKGVASKSPDVISCYACSTCHDIIDGRMKTNLTRAELLECELRGMQRTIMKLISKGLLTVQ